MHHWLKGAGRPLLEAAYKERIRLEWGLVQDLLHPGSYSVHLTTFLGVPEKISAFPPKISSISQNF